MSSAELTEFRKQYLGAWKIRMVYTRFESRSEATYSAYSAVSDEGSIGDSQFNGSQKKTQKTQPLQLGASKKIMKEYFKEKENG